MLFPRAPRVSAARTTWRFRRPERVHNRVSDGAERTEGPVRAPRIGLLVIDGVTLAAIAALRTRLETLGVQVLLLVPTGGALLPVGGALLPRRRRARCPLAAARGASVRP